MSPNFLKNIKHMSTGYLFSLTMILTAMIFLHKSSLTYLLKHNKQSIAPLCVSTLTQGTVIRQRICIST